MPKAGFTYGPRIPPPEPGYKQIAREAKKEVMDSLAGLVEFEDAVLPHGSGEEATKTLVFKAAPAELLDKTVEIIRQADAELALDTDARDKAIASLWFYEQRIGLMKTVGITSPNHIQGILSKALTGNASNPSPSPDTAEQLEETAKKAGVAHIKDAADTVVPLAVAVARARARREIALFYSQEAVWLLSQPPYNWKPQRIADYAEVSRDLIYHHRRTAAKRRGLI
ncbi:hypothetical protein ACIP88_27955 [Streptomyces uncialis]|uniref:hypothetical protein n=1 Tax=Streptomyces uncialis TaxID=1048205 RepID=UPI0037F3F8E3